MKAAGARRASVAQPAFVLHRWDWSESSLVLDLFTREQGRVAVVAKGAKRPYSQLRSVLLPFQRIQVLLGKPPADEAAEVQTLRSAEWAGGTIMPPGAGLFAGFYLNELLMKGLARHDPHERLFDGYDDSLRALAVGGEAAAPAVLRAFELLLLRDTGVLPELQQATLTQAALRDGAPYALRAEAGLVAAPGDEQAIEALHWRALQQALDRDDLAALRQACAAVLPALKSQLRALLHYHLGTATLRTRQVMQGVHRLLDLPTAATPR